MLHEIADKDQYLFEKLFEMPPIIGDSAVCAKLRERLLYSRNA